MYIIRITHQKLSDGSQEFGFFVGKHLLGVISKPAVGQRNWFWHGIHGLDGKGFVNIRQKFPTKKAAVEFAISEIKRTEQYAIAEAEAALDDFNYVGSRHHY